jgi:hypothetical protein
MNHSSTRSAPIRADGAIAEHDTLRRMYLAAFKVLAEVSPEIAAAEAGGTTSAMRQLIELAADPSCTENQMRAREAAASLLADFSDRLTPDLCHRCYSMARQDPDRIHPAAAQAMLALYRRIAGARR